MRTMVVLMVLALATLVQGSVTTDVLVNERADALKVRVGLPLPDPNLDAEVGVFGTWYVEDQSSPWGLGLYGKLVTNPGTTIPVADWLPGIGDLLGLPDAIEGETYALVELEVIDWSEDAGLRFGIGPGIRVGPLMVEYIYDVVDGGETDVGHGGPIVTSGPMLWFGGRWEF